MLRRWIVLGLVLFVLASCGGGSDLHEKLDGTWYEIGSSTTQVNIDFEKKELAFIFNFETLKELDPDSLLTKPMSNTFEILEETDDSIRLKLKDASGETLLRLELNGTAYMQTGSGTPMLLSRTPSKSTDEIFDQIDSGLAK